MLNLVERFFIGISMGSPNLRSFFGSRIVIADLSFRRIIEMVSGRYTCAGLACRVFRAESGTTDDEIISLFSIKTDLTGSQLCAMLTYLGSVRGAHLLSIPKDKKVCVIILGYATVERERRAVILQREVVVGKIETIKLRTQPLGEWGDNTPLVIVTVG